MATVKIEVAADGVWHEGPVGRGTLELRRGTAVDFAMAASGGGGPGADLLGHLLRIHRPGEDGAAPSDSGGEAFWFKNLGAQPAVIAWSPAP